MSTEQSSKPEHPPEQQSTVNEDERPEQQDRDQADSSVGHDEPGGSKSTSAQDESMPESAPLKPAGRSGWLLPVLAMFVLFTAGIVVLWLEQQQLGQRLQRAEQYGQNLQARLNESHQQQRQAIDANIELQRSLQATRELVIAQQQTPQADDSALLLHQALMLVRMAQAQLQVSQNIDAALQAMQWARQRLQDQDGELAVVRDQLQRDIQQLQQLPRRNHLALVQQLASLIDTVDRLPLRVAGMQLPRNQAAPVPEQETPSYTGWRSAVQAIWQEVKQLVVVRRREQPIQPLMTAEREQMLRDVLRQRLEGLQVQLMRESGAAQNVARARVSSWLRQWFDEANADVIAMRDWLNRLPEPSQALPDLQGSISALSNAIKQAAGTDITP